EYVVTNHSQQPTTGQAIPSVLPIQAAKYLQKTECFCFTPQSFAAGESRIMPVRFFLDPAMPEHIENVTISYQFLDSNGKVEDLNKRGRLL
ncbi:MAG: cytochrome c oxidase assembly protein, partial [Gammaproteobacteria bacterium]|nr:cytochrome c oxidase assembly protein [Gammaproteobacteria bacterium]